MKKVSVITMHRIYNYGSVLQAYATQKLLENKGFVCEIVDYISPFRAKKPLFLEYPPSLEGKKLKKFVYYTAKIPSFVLKEHTFGSFIKKNLRLTKQQYITNEDILKAPPQADIYISGSDQVWNSKYNHGVDKSYYLNYAPEGAKKYAFVSSFGKTALSQEEIDVVRPMLAEYQRISVREDSAVRLLSDMGLQSECLIDPTFQIERSHWEGLASRRLEKENYLLLFLLYNEDNGATEFAGKIAKEKGLKLVKLSWELKKPNGVDRLFTHRSPGDFLSLFFHADFIVTNSFHGTAFSINLNRPFIFVPRSEFNGRIESLLRLFHLENRRVSQENELAVVGQEMDYSAVNEILKKERERADTFLSALS
ncbi:MAG: polysaccharide pyruvyl transferase family protein [Ruminococcus sp.]|nr:polysaccharide pyruvyl transferase family protein [Ruminococcus sp.]